MKTTILCVISAAISSAITFAIIRDRMPENSISVEERAYVEGMRKVFRFSNGFAYQLEDILIQTHPKGAGWTRVIGAGTGPVPPISIDLLDGAGRSVFAMGAVRRQTDIMPGKVFHEATLSIWSNEPELEMKVTIFSDDESKRETISELIPNPVHFHRLLELDGASPSTLSIRST